MMKKMTIFLIAIALLSCLAIGCGVKSKVDITRKNNVAPGNGKGNIEGASKGDVDFEYFTFKESGMSAVEDVIAGYKTEDGVRLVMGCEFYGREEGDLEISREMLGGEDLLKEVQHLLGEADIVSWDGFAGANPPDILDGTSFTFECVLSDGRKISAHGSNNFPDSYSKLHRALFEMLYQSVIEDNRFSNKCYEVTLPDKWIGAVDVCYGIDYNAFYLNVEGNTEVYLMRIDFSDYEHLDDDDVIKLGKLISKDTGEEIYLSVYLYKSYMPDGVGTKEQQAVFETFKDDLDNIIDSIHPLEGYELVTQ